MKIRFVRKSRNTKTGPIAVTTTEEKSCPPSCPLKFVIVDGIKKLGPCYANFGPTAQRWREVSDFQNNWTPRYPIMICGGITKLAIYPAMAN